MPKLRFRLLTLIIAPFVLSSAVSIMIFAGGMISHLSEAQQSSIDTLVSTKVEPAGIYLGTGDYVALTAILDDLKHAAGGGRAEVLDPEGQLILGSGGHGREHNDRESVRFTLSYEGRILGFLTFRLDPTSYQNRVRALLISSVALLALVTLILTVVVLRAGDFILFWLSLDATQPVVGRHREDSRTPVAPQSHSLLVIALKCQPPRLVPMGDLRGLAESHLAHLDVLAPGEYELTFERGHAEQHAIDFYQAGATLFRASQHLNARWAISLAEPGAKTALSKRTRFLASLSQGNLLFEKETLSALSSTLEAANITAEPLLSPLASDLALFAAKLPEPGAASSSI